VNRIRNHEKKKSHGDYAALDSGQSQDDEYGAPITELEQTPGDNLRTMGDALRGRSTGRRLWVRGEG